MPRRSAIYLSGKYPLIDAEGRAHAYPKPPLLGGWEVNSQDRMRTGAYQPNFLIQPQIGGSGRVSNDKR